LSPFSVQNPGETDSGFSLAQWDEGHNPPSHDSTTQEVIMALTDTATRQAKATGKACTLGDLDDLSLAVST
jgi:hypothetical protein